jgi:hypothetical protein
MTPEEIKGLLTSPDIKSKLFTFNSQWWADNLDTVLDRWNEWILG